MFDGQNRKLKQGAWCRGCGKGLARGTDVIIGQRRIHGQVALLICLDCVEEITELWLGPPEPEENNDG